MPATVCLHCPNCNVRLKAPAVLLGQWRSCPGCTRRFHVRIQAPQDAGPVLVEERTAAAALAGPSAA